MDSEFADILSAIIPRAGLMRGIFDRIFVLSWLDDESSLCEICCALDGIALLCMSFRSLDFE